MSATPNKSEAKAETLALLHPHHGVIALEINDPRLNHAPSICGIKNRSVQKKISTCAGGIAVVTLTSSALGIAYLVICKISQTCT